MTPGSGTLQKQEEEGVCHMGHSRLSVMTVQLEAFLKSASSKANNNN